LFAQAHPQGAFWHEVHINFLDICILEWCKLFADRKGRKGQPYGEHHWRRLVAEPDRFETDLCTTLGVTADEFAALIAEVKRYRDKFIAHLDVERTMHRPNLTQPMKAVEFLFERLAREGHSHHEDWQRLRLPTTVAGLDWVYTQARQQAQSVYGEAIGRCL
jgi:hypothetical protein